MKKKGNNLIISVIFLQLADAAGVKIRLTNGQIRPTCIRNWLRTGKYTVHDVCQITRQHPSTVTLHYDHQATVSKRMDMACTLFSGTAVPVNQIKPAATVTSLATVPANLPTTPAITRKAPESPGPSHQEVIVKKTPPRQLLDLDPGVDDPFPNDDIAYDSINTQELIPNDEVLVELNLPVVKSNNLPEGSAVLASRPKFHFKRPNQPQVRSPAKKMRTPLKDIGNEIQDVTKGTFFIYLIVH